MDKLNKWNNAMRNLALLTQLGLSLIMPLLMCLAACYLLVSRLGIGAWVYIPGFILGLGGSFMTAWKVYLSVTAKQQKNPRGNQRGFNQHM